ncbi:MAG: apolipoprotein N-acyltransferase [Deltaproteobacteria bacterium]|nr:apolipoprotein N-acyltransferase [Deltaproteobacteria bacterium]
MKKIRLTPERREALRESWPALVTALLYVLAFPSAGLWPLAFVALAPTLAIAQGAKTTERTWWFGFVAGFVGNAGKLYWLVYTINHYGHFPLPAALVVFSLLCGFLGVFWGYTFWLTRRVGERVALPLSVVFPLAWMTQEWVLTWFLTGFPWSMIGHALVGWLPMAQAADVIGGLGLSFPVALGNAVIYEIWKFARERQSRPDRRFPVGEFVTFAMWVVALAVYGFLRIPAIDQQMASGRAIRVGMTQGNIDQNEKWNPGNQDRTFETYLAQAKKTVVDGASLVLMPETALPYWQTQGRALKSDLREFVDGVGAWTLIAVPTKVENPDDPEWPYKYNSVVLASPDGDLSDWYNKHRLVPFGEYLPLKKLSVPLVKWLRSIPALSKLRLSAGFYPGEEYIVFPHPEGRFGMAICYEIIYPGIVRKVVNLGTDFMVTITNDAWFGDTSAPHQHWDQVRMRAIEHRKYFARSANTGISGVIDAAGRTKSATGTYVPAAVTDDVRTMNVQTIYSRLGDWFQWVCVLAFLAFSAIAYARARRARAADGV